MSDAPRLSEVRSGGGAGGSSSLLIVGIVVGVFMAICGVGVMAAIAIPNFVAMQLKSKRAEVPGYVDGIKTAELAYDAAFDSYVPVGSERAATLELEAGSPKAQREWVGGPDWEKLGWFPDGKVRGAYWVETTATGFRVVGICDVDGDGNFARYEADEAHNATLTTDRDVY